MLLPGCDCGNCGCACGTLPYTITASFSGFEKTSQTKNCELVITGTFGCNATGVVLEPGGCDTDKGPIGKILLTNGGEGFAKVGHVVPVLTITGSGTGATFTPTLAAIDNSLAEQCRSYKITSIAASGGSGYKSDELLKISPNGAEVTKAVAKLTTSRSEPTVTASVSGGEGAVLGVTLSSSGAPPTWGVSSVSVTKGGGGYTDGASVSFSAGAGDVLITPATATISATPITTSPPTPFLRPMDSGGGAAFDFAWTASGDRWSMTGVTITSGGGGYVVGSYFEWYLSEGAFLASDFDSGFASIRIDAVDGNGSVTEWSWFEYKVDFVGVPGPGGEITGVSVSVPGEYYNPDGAAVSVEVLTAGEYYTEDTNAPACVADVTVVPCADGTNKACVWCGGGTDAVITPTIDVLPLSPTFGEIVDLELVDGGENYLAWRWVCLFHDTLNGQEVVLKAQNPRRLVLLRVESKFGSGACLRVDTDLYDGTPCGIDQIDVLSGGVGYAIAGEDIAPTLSASVGGGSGLSLSVAMTKLSENYGVSGVTVKAGGSGFPFTGKYPYEVALPVTFATSSVVLESATAVALPVIVAPNLSSAVTVTSGQGVGLELIPSLAATTDKGLPCYTVSGVSIANAGTGFTKGDLADIEAPNRGTSQSGVVRWTVTDVGANGEVTELSAPDVAEFFSEATGAVESISVTNQGRYVSAGVEVAAATVVVDQAQGSTGVGFKANAIVQSDPSKANFGQIIGVSITNPGSGYSLLGGPANCRYTTFCAGTKGSILFNVIAQGGLPMTAEVSDSRDPDNIYFAKFRSAGPVLNCNKLPAALSPWYGETAGLITISNGGKYQGDLNACSLLKCPPEGLNLTVTSDIPCADGGTADYDGLWDDFEGTFDCGHKDTPGGEVSYFNEVYLTLTCCEGPCDDPCSFGIEATVSGYCYNPETDTFSVVDGYVECSDLGETINIPIYVAGQLTYTMAVQIT